MKLELDERLREAKGALISVVGLPMRADSPSVIRRIAFAIEAIDDVLDGNIQFPEKRGTGFFTANA